MIPEIWEIWEASSMIAPAYCLKRVSGSQQEEVEPRTSPVDSLSRGDSWESKENKEVKVHSTPEKRDHQRETSGSLQGVSLKLG